MGQIVNGLDATQFPPIAFIDLDDVVFKHPETFIEGVPDRLIELAKTYRLVLFSSGISEGRLQKLKDAGVPVHGWIAKPLACSYIWIDDRLQPGLCAKELVPGTCPW